MAHGMVAELNLLAVCQHTQDTNSQGDPEKDIEFPVNDVVSVSYPVSGMCACKTRHDGNTDWLGAYKFTKKGEEIQE